MNHPLTLKTQILKVGSHPAYILTTKQGLPLFILSSAFDCGWTKPGYTRLVLYLASDSQPPLCATQYVHAGELHDLLTNLDSRNPFIQIHYNRIYSETEVRRMAFNDGEGLYLEKKDTLIELYLNVLSSVVHFHTQADPFLNALESLANYRLTG